MTDKTIFSNDAEIAVLSIVLNNTDVVHELDGLKSYMFSSSPHEALFLEIQQMIERQIPPEPALIVAQLEASDTISKIGGKKYIEQICSTAYNKDALQEYKNIVIKAWFLIQMEVLL